MTIVQTQWQLPYAYVYRQICKLYDGFQYVCAVLHTSYATTLSLCSEKYEPLDTYSDNILITLQGFRLLVVIGAAKLKLAHQAPPAEQKRRERFQELLMHRPHQAGKAIQRIIQHNARKAACKHGACPGGPHEHGHLYQLPRLIPYLASNDLEQTAGL